MTALLLRLEKTFTNPYFLEIAEDTYPLSSVSILNFEGVTLLAYGGYSERIVLMIRGTWILPSLSFFSVRKAFF